MARRGVPRTPLRDPRHHLVGMLSPRPFAGVDDPVAILVEAGIIIRAPIFVGAQIAVVMAVEGGPARLVGALPVARIEPAAIPAIGIFGPADAAVMVGVP